MSRFGDYIAFWRNWDDQERSTAKVVAGLLTGVFCLFILISCVSYLFHWQQDMSLLGDPSMMDSATEVGNAAGKLGYRTGHLLIGSLFGLGSFALLIILVAVSIRLIARKWNYSLIKTTLLAVSGTVVASLLLAFAGNLAGIPDIFGGGLGGEFGRQVVLWGNNLFGLIICGAIILLLLICWLFFTSKHFSSWVYNLGHKKEDDGFQPEDTDDYKKEEVEVEPEDVVPAEEVSPSSVGSCGPPPVSAPDLKHPQSGLRQGHGQVGAYGGLPDAPLAVDRDLLPFV